MPSPLPAPPIRRCCSRSFALASASGGGALPPCTPPGQPRPPEPAKTKATVSKERGGEGPLRRRSTCAAPPCDKNLALCDKKSAIVHCVSFCARHEVPCRKI